MDDRELRALLKEVMEDLDQGACRAVRQDAPPGQGGRVLAAALAAGLGAASLGAVGLGVAGLAGGGCSGPQGGRPAPTPVTTQVDPDYVAASPDAGQARPAPAPADAGQAAPPAPDARPVDPGTYAEYAVPPMDPDLVPAPSMSPPRRRPMRPMLPDREYRPLYGVPRVD